MVLFYAYLKDDQGDSSRYLLTFVSREIADEWWRTISTPPSPYATNIKRISPQFYTQDNVNDTNVIDFFSHPNLLDGKQFHRKMFITALRHSSGSRSTIVRAVKFADHISGRWYFVRSKGDPWCHWYLRIKGPCLVCGGVDCNRIHVSSEHRTKFCVRVRSPANGAQIPEDFVMIGRDKISISAPKGYILRAEDEGDLKATKDYEGETDLVFGDLKDRFITRAEKQVNGEIWEYVESVEKGSGEAWELTG